MKVTISNVRYITDGRGASYWSVTFFPPLPATRAFPSQGVAFVIPGRYRIMVCPERADRPGVVSGRTMPADVAQAIVRALIAEGRLPSRMFPGGSERG